MGAADQWHRRFIQQARWTESVRRFLFAQARLDQAKSVLEVGCGSGAILTELSRQTNADLVGIDLKLDSLAYARNHNSIFSLIGADALRLPFAAETFSHTCCHFFLLWVNDPLQALQEMKRVTEPHGFVMALAEPDYGARIDYPPSLAHLGQLQWQSLSRQGADPLMGRKFKGLFHQAGLQNVQAGLLGGQWNTPPSPEEWESEWETLESDLAGALFPAELTELKRLDAAAWRKGERILFVPTFYAIGQV